MRKYALFCVVCLVPALTWAGDTLKSPVVLSVYNNATLLPGAGKLGVWGTPVHPGLTVGTEFYYRRTAHGRWLQTANLAYHYHQYALHSIQLYSEAGYRHLFRNQLDAEARLGLGYLHSIPDSKIYELDEEGAYRERTNLGRPQGMASLAIGMGYAFQGPRAPRIFLLYRFYIQVPFVNEYVPVLPNTALHLGVALPVMQ
ncbi:MAG: hypothetical protein H6564_04490 [Lewinellaceae bacterium]|nr:hypothetical protein [Lewinellaceae bacterium]